MVLIPQKKMFFIGKKEKRAYRRYLQPMAEYLASKRRVEKRGRY